MKVLIPMALSARLPRILARWNLLACYLPLLALAPLLGFQAIELGADPAWWLPLLLIPFTLVGILVQARRGRIWWYAVKATWHSGDRGLAAVSAWRLRFAVTLLGLCAGAYALAVWQFSPWLAHLIAIGCVVGWGLVRFANLPWSRVVAWGLLLLATLPGPNRLDERLVARLQALAATSSSHALDAVGVPHIRTGPLFELEGLEFTVGEACSDWAGLRALLAVAAVSLYLSGRSGVVAACAVVSVPVWFMLANFWRLISVALGMHYLEQDLVHGSWGVTVEAGIFLLAALAYWLTELCLDRLLRAVPPTEPEYAFLFRSLNAVLNWPHQDEYTKWQPEQQGYFEEDVARRAKETSPRLVGNAVDGARPAAVVVSPGKELLQDWVGALTRPFLLFQGVLEVINSWLWSRQWRVAWLGVCLVLLAGGSVGSSLWGANLDPLRLAADYSRWAEEETQRFAQQAQQSAAEAGSEGESDLPRPLVESEGTSAYGELLYRRLMRLDSGSPRGQFMVAQQLLRGGKGDEARQLLSSLAPATARGYAPAHAWMAADLLSRKAALEKPEQAALLSHLAQACSWEGVSPRMRAAYAELLEAQGQPMDAIRVLARAAQEEPQLQLMLTAMAARHGVKKTAEESSLASQQYLEKRAAEPEPEPEILVQLATLHLLKMDADQALTVVMRGLKETPDHPQLRRIASEALRFKYRQSVQRSEQGVMMDLRLLDAALKADPTNMALSEELAFLIELGVQLPPELADTFQQQLSAGQATAVAHVVLANQKIRSEKIAESIPHLELALQKAPDSPLILNNLAMALLLVDDAQLARAEQLVARALQVGGPNPDFYDTQGQVMLKTERLHEGVAALENALELAPKRLDIRQMLAAAYRRLGLEDLAQTHEKFIAQAEAEAQRPAQPTSAPLNAATDGTGAVAATVPVEDPAAPGEPTTADSAGEAAPTEDAPPDTTIQ
jgi:hypothetical protein